MDSSGTSRLVCGIGVLISSSFKQFYRIFVLLDKNEEINITHGWFLGINHSQSIEKYQWFHIDARLNPNILDHCMSKFYIFHQPFVWKENRVCSYKRQMHFRLRILANLVMSRFLEILLLNDVTPAIWLQWICYENTNIIWM